MQLSAEATAISGYQEALPPAPAPRRPRLSELSPPPPPPAAPGYQKSCPLSETKGGGGGGFCPTPSQTLPDYRHWKIRASTHRSALYGAETQEGNFWRGNYLNIYFGEHFVRDPR